MGDFPLERDWDILIVLDACRYDYFEKYNPYKGKLSKFDMGCRGTKEFLHSFKHKDCSDIILVNHIILFREWVGDNTFAKVVNVHDTNWDKKYGTVLPEVNTEVALKVIRENPSKRVVVHYAQPHVPFLDRNVSIIKEKTMEQVVNKTIYKNKLVDNLMKRVNTLKTLFPPMPFWYLEKTLGNGAGIGEIYFKEGWAGIEKSYVYNLKRVLKSIEKIVELNHKVVITSDHGELLGELGMFGHGHHKTKIVTTVPWFEVS